MRTYPAFAQEGLHVRVLCCPGRLLEVRQLRGEEWPVFLHLVEVPLRQALFTQVNNNSVLFD
jgi:hypothetical protein